MINVICPDDGETRQVVEIDLEEINVQVDEEHTNKIINFRTILQLS